MNSRTTHEAKEQIDFIYIVRALAILGVIFVHVTSVPVVEIADKQSWMFLVFNFLNVFHKFGTTTFIFLSAFVLFYSYYDRPFGRTLIARFYKRRFLYILVPYLVCSAYYYAIKVYFSYGGTWEQFVERASLLEFLQMTALGNGFYHLYFVFINVQFYMLFPFLLWLLQRRPGLARHLIWGGLALQWAFVLLNYYVLHYPDKGHLALSYLANFFLGAYCGIYYSKIKNGIWMGKRPLFWLSIWGLWLAASLSDVYLWHWTRASGTFVHALIYEALWFLHAYTSALILVQLSEWLYRKLKPVMVNVLLHLGVVSFGVYILHAAVLFFYFKLPVSHQPILYSLYVAGGFVFTLFVTWGIVGLVQKHFRWSWVLFGAKPKVSPYRCQTYYIFAKAIDNSRSR